MEQAMNVDLRSCLDFCKQLGYDDYKAIEIFLEQDANKGAELLYKVMTRRIDQLEKFENDTKALMSRSVPYYYQDFDQNTAACLDTLTRKMMMQMPFDEEDVAFMRQFNLDSVRNCFWHDLYEAIKSVQNDTYEPEYYNYRRPS